MNPERLISLEFDLLLDAIQRRHGYDFRNYSPASLRRRIFSLMKRLGIEQVSACIPRVLHDDKVFNALLEEMSITVTEMFRDPDFYAALRRDVAPRLFTYPLLKIWHAGCATGQEVYSLAILLQEEGLLRRAQIYATDFNNHSLDIAREAIYPLEKMRTYQENYNRSNPKGSFSDYYLANNSAAKLVAPLGRNVTFANHNLVTDGVFGEMTVILCRNVLIYFDKSLQDRVLRLFRESLVRGGYLCLGPKETLERTSVEAEFEVISAKDRIYRRRHVSPGAPEGGGHD